MHSLGQQLVEQTAELTRLRSACAAADAARQGSKRVRKADAVRGAGVKASPHGKRTMSRTPGGPIRKAGPFEGTVTDRAAQDRDVTYDIGDRVLATWGNVPHVTQRRATVTACLVRNERMAYTVEYDDALHMVMLDGRRRAVGSVFTSRRACHLQAAPVASPADTVAKLDFFDMHSGSGNQPT